MTVLGIMLGTAALVITLSVLSGFEREIKEKVVAFTSHIQILGYQNEPLREYRRSIERVKEGVPGVKSISPFAAKEGMIRSRSAVDGILLKGIDVSEEIVAPRQHLIKGRFLVEDGTGPAQVVIGSKLARKLAADVGDKLVVFALPMNGAPSLQPRAMQFQLAGIYESGMAEFDDIYAYTTLRNAQKLFRLDDDVTGFDVLVNDITKVDEVAGRIESLLGSPHFARSVFQLYRNLFSWVELQKKLSPLLLSLITVVATVNMIGTILMFVLEKTRAVAILKSLGAGPSIIRRIFILQGLSIALGGVVLGNLLAYVFCWIQLNFRILSLPSDIYYMSSVPILLQPANFLLVSGVALVMSFVTTLLPSAAAARLDPVVALRFG
ncbi:MAG: ABC transporter permease [Ignavibacteria bacterium]|nr:MAG: ABC transporter permease [Ignavibacteria bacterium]